MKHLSVFQLALALAVGLILAACGSAGNTAGGGTTPTTPTSTPANIGITASPLNVKTDNSTSSTITVTVTDAGSAAVSNATVTFASTGGLLSTASATTDAAGQATATFSAGSNRSNQIATITATVLGVTPTLSAQIPVQIVGSTVTAIQVNSGITNDGAITDTLTVTAKDAGGNAINNIPVSFTQSGTGAVTITPATGTTNASGQVTVTVTGITAGSVTVTASAAGATAAPVYTVSAAANTFAISSPVTDPYGLTANTPLTVSVNAVGVTNVTFASSLGVWNGLTSVQTVAVAGGVASATFTSATAGVSSIQVFDAANPATSDTMSIAISQPASAATQISLQSNVNVVAPSIGGATNIATLTATVRDVNGQAVGGAPVHFTIPSPTGGGETVSPVVVYTDSLGNAQTTFTSGSVSTGGQGVDIYANVLTPAIGPAIANIVIGGTSGSVVIGKANKITELSPTAYSLPMSVQVADGNGNPVANATVSLKAWPTFYRFGFWYLKQSGSGCFAVAHPSGGTLFNIPNEDVNRNTILDPGEDQTHLVSSVSTTFDAYGNPVLTYGAAFTTPGNDAALTPHNSVAGTVPATVTTDANGVGNFDLVYLKNNAVWVTDEITASTMVSGTETTGRVEFDLPILQADVDGCWVSNSPFNEGNWPD